MKLIRLVPRSLRELVYVALDAELARVRLGTLAEVKDQVRAAARRVLAL